MLSIENQKPILRIEVGEHRMEDIERQLIHATLCRFGGNKAQTARSLGICIKTLYNKLGKYEAA